MSMELNALEELETLGVSLVEAGANNKTFAIAKSKEPDMGNEILKAVLDVEMPEQEAKLEEALKGLSPKAMKAAKGMLRIANSFKDELPKGLLKQLAKLSGLDEEEPTKKSLDESAELEKLHPEMRDKIKSLWKANDEAVKKAAEAEEALRIERNSAIKKEFIEKAEKEYDGLPIDSESLGVLLKSAYEAGDELGKSVEDLVKKSDAALKSGNTFKEIGTSQPAERPAHAWGSIEKKSKELVEKSAGNLSFAQAMDRIIKDEPSLYESYLAENNAQTGRR